MMISCEGHPQHTNVLPFMTHTGRWLLLSSRFVSNGTFFPGSSSRYDGASVLCSLLSPHVYVFVSADIAGNIVSPSSYIIICQFFHTFDSRAPAGNSGNKSLTSAATPGQPASVTEGECFKEQMDVCVTKGSRSENTNPTQHKTGEDYS